MPRLSLEGLRIDLIDRGLFACGLPELFGEDFLHRSALSGDLGGETGLFDGIQLVEASKHLFQPVLVPCLHGRHGLPGESLTRAPAATADQ
jgi:hypothetical protein